MKNQVAPIRERSRTYSVAPGGAPTRVALKEVTAPRPVAFVTLDAPRVVPIRSSCAETPVPAVQVNVTDVPSRVEPGVGVSICDMAVFAAPDHAESEEILG